MTQISAAMVKQLRDRTGAGMMDCKHALVETSGDQDKAVEIIQKKGLAKAAKKAGAIAAEGVVNSYIHPGSRVGVLVEVNCQTDFVSRNEAFQEFVEDVALQIASMSPLYVRREEVPTADVERQKQIFQAQLSEEDAKSGKARPAQAVEKILEGKLNKWFAEVCLMEQAEIRDSKMSLQQRIDELAAKIGEKIVIRRFARFELGEGIERKSADLAAEVAQVLQN